MAIWYVLSPFGIFTATSLNVNGQLVYISNFGMTCQEKSGSPGLSKNHFFPSLPVSDRKRRPERSAAVEARRRNVRKPTTLKKTKIRFVA
jgi:hypothetical protein